jgi:putative ABC transport system permease protein
MLLSLFGFFGVVSYHLHQEEVNMAVRKVYGVTNREVMVHYLKTKLRLYVLPNLVATAVSVYFSLNWLQNFVYHESIPLVLTMGLVSILAAFVSLSIITSGVVQAVCSQEITNVLQK